MSVGACAVPTLCWEEVIIDTPIFWNYFTKHFYFERITEAQGSCKNSSEFGMPFTKLPPTVTLPMSEGPYQETDTSTAPLTRLQNLAVPRFKLLCLTSGFQKAVGKLWDSRLYKARWDHPEDASVGPREPKSLTQTLSSSVLKFPSRCLKLTSTFSFPVLRAMADQIWLRSLWF